MPTKNVAPLDEVHAALFTMIKADLDRKVAEANQMAALRCGVIRKSLGCPEGAKLDFSDGQNGTIVATWDTADEEPKLKLVTDIDGAGVSAAAAVVAP